MQTYLVGVDNNADGSALADDSRRVQMAASYDGTDASNKRRAVSTVLKSEDEHANSTERRNLTAGGRDLIRNYAICGWAVRKHLDFIASHTLNIGTADKGLNHDLASFFAEWFEICDIQDRVDFYDFARMGEARRTVEGDVGCLYLRSGHLQGIESERIKNPPKMEDPDRWDHGVRTNHAGRPQLYSVHRRKRGGGLVHERNIRASNFHLLAYRERFDQVRGISPMAPAFNGFRDAYETQVLGIARAKVANMFGLVFYRDAEEAPAPTVEEASSANADGESRYEVDFGKGPISLDLDDGDRAEFLKNETGAVDHAAMIKLTLQLALLCLDLPWAFLDAKEGGNYNAIRTAMILYNKSAKHKRRGLRRWLKRTGRWRLILAIQTGEIVLPRSVDVRDVIRAMDWISDGTPWWDPSKETRADIMAVSAGIKTRTEIRRERYGDSWEDKVVPELIREQGLIDEAASHNVVISNSTGGAGSGNGDDAEGETRK